MQHRIHFNHPAAITEEAASSVLEGFTDHLRRQLPAIALHGDTVPWVQHGASSVGAD